MRTLVLACCLSLALAALAKPVTITCTVLDPDGKPAAGAKVMAYFYQTDDHEETTSTGADGRFTFSAELPQQESRFPAGRVAIYRPGLALGGGSLPWEGMTYRLQVSAKVSGTVVDAQGKPVADAVVRLADLSQKEFTQTIFLPDTLREAFTVRTDATGRWTLKDVPAVGKAGVELCDPRFVRERIRAPLDGGEVPVLKARPGATITGLACFEDGRPAAGMRVFCQGTGMNNAWAEAHTGADGRYRLAGLSSGPVNVMFEDPKGEWIAAAQESVPAVEGQETAAGDLVATAGAFVEGSVTGKETGKPIPGASIGSYGPHRPRSSAAIISATTDDRGHYRLRVAPGQSYVYISGTPPDFIQTDGVNLQVKPGETKVQSFRLSTGIVIKGRVIDTDGNPVEEKDLSLALTVTGSRRGYVEPRYARIGTDGLTFSGLMAGTGRLYLDYSARPCEWELLGPTEINVPLGGPLTVTLRKSPLRTLHGRVVTPLGQPVAGAAVNLDESMRRGNGGMSMRRELLSGTDGTFTMSDISPTLELSFLGAEKDGYQYVSGGQVTNGAEPAITDIVMAPLNVTVRGKVVDADGKPAAGALVISAEAGMSAMTTTDAAGAFTLSGQLAGEITLLAAKERSFAALQNKPGEPAVLKLAPAPPQPPQALARGAQLLDELLQETVSKDYYARDFLPFELLPYDRERAKKLLPAGGGQMAGYALALAVAENIADVSAQELDDCLAQLGNIPDQQEQLAALATVGTALAGKDRARAQEIYLQVKQLAGAGGNTAEHAMVDVLLAKLALKLNNGEADDWIEQAMTVARGMEDDEGLGAAIAEALAEVNPQAAVKVAKSLPVNEHSAPSALARVIEIMARTDPQEAKLLLADLPKGDDWSTRYSCGYAAKYVVAALAKDDPAGMLALARTIADPEQRLQALAAVAPHLPKEEAVKVLREAAVAGMGDERNLKEFIQLAAAASSIDKALGDELFAEAMKRVEAQQANRTTLAWALRDTNPAAGRLLLESTVRQLTAKPDAMNPGRSLLPVALAMAPLDFDRAWEIARAIPEGEDQARYDTQRKLIQYLLAPEGVRATIPLDRWSASDSWRPGQPTNW
ncbi:MAG: carboxypeptidase regulatory-like domain-containing protein [Armatimonadota bacterium]